MHRIEWVPLHIPLQRRLQTLATALIVLILAMPIVSFLLIALLLFYGGLILRTLVLMYLAYMYVDHKRYHSAIDGNGWKINRNNPVYRYYRNYFPVDLVKTAELPANRNYIVASFPHGIVGAGVGVNMGMDIGKWLDLYPQVRPKVCTLDQNFLTPILREIVRSWGLISVSKESLTYFLTKSNDPHHSDNRDGFTSNAVAILVGGAQEAMDSHPGEYILTLKKRKGFVRMAIRTGSSIVPSISFGEVDIFDQVANPPNSWLRRLQNVVKQLTGISPLIPIGRGFFNYSFGFLPQRRRIVQVVGSPIDVLKNDQPDSAYVDQIHDQVMKDLIKLFDEHKKLYSTNSEDSELVIR